MKKIILFSLASIICLTISTKINAMQWLTIKNKIYRYNDLRHCGFKVVLSHNATWEQFHTAQKDEIILSNIGDSLAQDLALDYQKKHHDLHAELLPKITELYIKSIIQQEELAPRYFNNSKDQTNYQTLINDLRTQLQE